MPTGVYLKTKIIESDSFNLISGCWIIWNIKFFIIISKRPKDKHGDRESTDWRQITSYNSFDKKWLPSDSAARF